MIKELRKICGYNPLVYDPGSCFHPLNVSGKKAVECSENVCPFILYFENTILNDTEEYKKTLLKDMFKNPGASRMVKDYLLIKENT